MWERDEDRIALVELLQTGSLRRRHTQADAWSHLDQLSWTRRGSRRDELILVGDHRGALVDLLDRVWPGWRKSAMQLEQKGLPSTPKGLRTLLDEQRANELGPLPERLNLRTATAAVGPHSKATLGARRRQALGGTEVTRDGIVRVRAPEGTVLVRGSTRLAAEAITEVLGEVAIAERALRDGTSLEGPIRAVLLVENLGPFQDLQPPPGWLVAHVPGWNTAAVRLLLADLEGTPVVHFGDLDPNGVRIVHHLRSLHPELRWAVPRFWEERVSTHALKGAWPADLDLTTAAPLVRSLAERGEWLEQESIALDPRLAVALEQLVGGSPRGSGH